MATRVKSLGVETLENRLNLSSMAGLVSAPASGVSVLVRDQATLGSSVQRITLSGSISVLTAEQKAALIASVTQRTTSTTTPSTAPTTTPTPAPSAATTGTTTTTTTTTSTTPTTTTTTTNTNAAFPVTVTTSWMTSYTRLTITGTSGHDSILVSKDSGGVTITANGVKKTIAGNFGEIMVYGGAGNDALTIDSSVNIASLIYGGDGSNTLTAKGSGKMSIIAIGNGTNYCVGNGVNTSFWVNTNDTVVASAAEQAVKAVNRVNNWYQPWTTSTSSPDYIQRSLNGQNIKDPTDSGTTKRLTANGFFGTGAVISDVQQKGIADCYFMGNLASLAHTSGHLLQQMAVDLGDGTYAFRFTRNGVTSYVRVDGDLSAGGQAYGLRWSTTGSTGNQWAMLFEKAYAYYRKGENTYSSLGWGSMGAVQRDLGLTSSSLSVAWSTADTVLARIQSQLANKKALVTNTKSTVTSGSGLVTSHVYSVTGAYKDANGNVMITLRNPWGGSGDVKTISWATYQANFNSLTYVA